MPPIESILHETIAEGWRVAPLLHERLRRDFPEGTAVLTVHQGHETERHEVPVDQLGPLLDRWCRHFPQARLEYHPESAYGFVAQAGCHCSCEGSAGCCMAKGAGRTRLLVVIHQSKNAATPAKNRGGAFSTT